MESVYRQNQNVIIELIETLWNVNFMRKEYYEKIKKELIETLWNVNITRTRILFLAVL